MPFSQFRRPSFVALIVLAGLAVFAGRPAAAQQHITTPKEEFGFDIGDDYQLANYTQLEAYWKKLAAESPRMMLEAIGETAEGRTQWMAVVTAPENFARLGEYKANARALALAKDLSEEEARQIARDSKAVVWIDGGLHATEVVGAHQLMQMVYELVSRDDPETLRFLDDIVILLGHANPDGMELVSNWYMRMEKPEDRSIDNLPRLYQKYIGHDNNRDSYLNSQPETENISRVMYRSWFPQIMYNHHQTGPADIIVFVPPFRDPPNYNYDPLVIVGTQAVGTAMHQRLIAEGKGGSGARRTSSYSMWFNGNIRTVGYFHNQIGILTEIKGNPTPMELPFWPDRQLMTNDFALPHVPGEFHFRDAIDYSITMNRAVLDYASRNREKLLFNRWRMGMNSIERGSRDSWTVHPRVVYEVEQAIREKGEQAFLLEHSFRRRGDGVSKEFLPMFRQPENRDARGYIIPAGQRDFPTAVKFLDALIKSGIEVERATADFEVAGKQYAAGSFVVKTAQAFRPHILDMFEAQDHPDEFLYEGGPPIPPYDNAGYTLAYQMGVEFDRILDGFDGPFEAVDGFAEAPAGRLIADAGTAGFLLSHAENDSAIAVNRLLASGHDVFWLRAGLETETESWPAGTIYIRAKDGTTGEIEAVAGELGVDFTGVAAEPQGAALKLNPVRIALWDQYGGSMSAGWTRWLMERFEFPFARIYAPDIDDGGLDGNYDALILVSGAVAEKEPFGSMPQMEEEEVPPDPATIPTEYRGQLGEVTEETTIPKILDYLRAGGDVLAIGSSTRLAEYAGLPIGDHLVDGEGEPLKAEDFYIPSSLLEVRVDTNQPLAYGIRERATVTFDESPVMRLRPEADKQGVTQVAWFDSDRALRSGWAWGEDRLYGGTAVARAKVGEGRLSLFGPEILFRGQSHNTFQFLFNGLYLAGAEAVMLGGAETGDIASD